MDNADTSACSLGDHIKKTAWQVHLMFIKHGRFLAVSNYGTLHVKHLFFLKLKIIPWEEQ